MCALISPSRSSLKRGGYKIEIEIRKDRHILNSWKQYGSKISVQQKKWKSGEKKLVKRTNKEKLSWLFGRLDHLNEQSLVGIKQTIKFISINIYKRQVMYCLWLNCSVFSFRKINVQNEVPVPVWKSVWMQATLSIKIYWTYKNIDTWTIFCG